MIKYFFLCLKKTREADASKYVEIMLSLIEVAYCYFHTGGWINYITEVMGKSLMDGGI